MTDHYETLGVGRGATEDEIKVAFRTLRSRWHPDREGGDDAKMQEINAANDVLSDPEKRAKYDRETYLGAKKDVSQAIDQIGGAFSMWMDSPQSESQDPIEFINNSVHETLERIHKDIRGQRQRIDRYNRLMTRVKYKGPEGDNIFQGTISGQLDDAQEELQRLEGQLRVTGIVKKLMLEYEHVPGARSSMPSVFFQPNYQNPDKWASLK